MTAVEVLTERTDLELSGSVVHRNAWILPTGENVNRPLPRIERRSREGFLEKHGTGTRSDSDMRVVEQDRRRGRIRRRRPGFQFECDVRHRQVAPDRRPRRPWTRRSTI